MGAGGGVLYKEVKSSSVMDGEACESSQPTKADRPGFVRRSRKEPSEMERRRARNRRKDGDEALKITKWAWIFKAAPQTNGRFIFVVPCRKLSRLNDFPSNLPVIPSVCSSVHVGSTMT